MVVRDRLLVPVVHDCGDWGEEEKWTTRGSAAGLATGRGVEGGDERNRDLVLVLAWLLLANSEGRFREGRSGARALGRARSRRPHFETSRTSRGVEARERNGEEREM